MKNNKGFTLIEFIVTIAILGILVLLASPRFFGYTQNAERTKGFANARTIEKASELYYMDHEDWPRLTDEPYTSEEIESYSERIFDNTGQEVNLDPEGNYYDIDYDKLSDYVQVPDDKKNYILQNPVGKVFYMENLNEAGIARVNYSNVEEENDNPIPIGGLTVPVISRDPEDGEIPINSASDFNKIRQSLNGNYILTSDIDLSRYSEGEGWTPIGSYTSSTNKNPFTGSFNGNGYSITGLTINMPTTDNVGLFGYTEKATIKNVALEDVDIKGKNRTGGLVGYASQSSVTNSYVTGEVTGTGSNTGGLVGYAENSSITNSYATGAVTGTGYRSTGGLVGYAFNVSTITNSYATGSVTGESRTGGLVGIADVSTTITNSYATGSVMGTDYTGGLAGRAIFSSTISNSYATGSVTGTSEVGGLVGNAGYSSKISNSYATGSVTGASSVGALVGRMFNTDGHDCRVEYSYALDLGLSLIGSRDFDSDSGGSSSRNIITGSNLLSHHEMKQRNSYSGWNFNTIWQIDEGVSYPTLR